MSQGMLLFFAPFLIRGMLVDNRIKGSNEVIKSDTRVRDRSRARDVTEI